MRRSSSTPARCAASWCRASSPRADASLLVAPDSFKGTFSAPAVAAAMARDLDADVCPVGDGGEGTAEVLGAAPVEAVVSDPLGRPVRAAYGVLGDGSAIVEVAAASGLGLVAPEERDAVAASTRGTGELIAAAAAAGARRILVAVGGSATTDGGAGALAAMGDLSGVELVCLCDVRTPFELAAAVFAPQKGADASAVERLTVRLHELAARLPRDPRGLPMTGAAGGLAGGLWAAHGAELVAGAAFVLDAVDFDARLARAEAVLTGEGRLDAQTLEGKAVAEVAARAARAGKPVHAIVGECALEPAALGLASVTKASTLEEIAAAAAALS